jgi:hypothetical protein
VTRLKMTRLKTDSDPKCNLSILTRWSSLFGLGQSPVNSILVKTGWMLLKLFSIFLLLNLVHAKSWDLADEFSQTNNPAGPWFWGWLDDEGDFTPFPTSGAYDGGATGWQDHYLNHSGRVVKNSQDHVIENESCYIHGQVVLHPGIHLEKKTGVRWTSESEGVVMVEAGFSGLNLESGTTTNVYVHHNGNTLFQASIEGFAGCPGHSPSGGFPSADFKHVLKVRPGDMLDFSVDHGGNGAMAVRTGAGNDSTGLDVKINEVEDAYGEVTGVVKPVISYPQTQHKARIQTPDGNYSTLSRGDGGYAMMLPYGDHTLQLIYPGFPIQESNVTITGPNPATLDWQLDAAVLVLTVRSDRPGKPYVPGCLVRIKDSPFSVRTSQQGGSLLIAPPGSYTLNISSHGNEQKQLKKTLTAGSPLFEDVILNWKGLTPMDPGSYKRTRQMAGRYPESSLPGVDISWHMDRAIEYMLNTIDLEQGGLPWSVNRVYTSPAQLEHSDADLPHNTARYLLAMMTWEEATGRRVRDEKAVQMLRNLLHGSISDVDHLAHAPNPGGESMEFADMHSRREVLLALLGLARMRDDRKSEDYAARMIESLVAEERTGLDLSPLVSARMIRALVMHHRYYNDAQSISLAFKYAEKGILRISDKQGRVTLSHMHSVLGALSGLVELGLHTSTPGLIEHARLMIDQGLSPHRTRFGFIYEGDMAIGRGEANNPADLVRSEILLGLNGYPEYLDDAERIIRNHLLASQFLDPSRAGKPGEGEPSPEDTPRFRYTAAAQRLCGGFSFTDPNDLVDGIYFEKFDMAADLVSGALEGLAAAWNSIVTQDAAGLRVNLLFSRDTPNLKVRSHLPEQGRVELIIRKPVDVYLRIPAYVNSDDLCVTLNGKTLVDIRVTGSYLHIPNRSGSATAVVEFEQVVAIRHTSLGCQTYTEEWLGDTLWNILPTGDRIPIYFPARLALYGSTP